MVENRLGDLDISAITKTAHWDPQSQRYAGVDHLLSALHHGWQVETQVKLEQCSYSAVSIFHFLLRRAGEMQVMPVIYTPCVDHVIAQYDLEVVPLSRTIIVQVERG